MSYRAMLICVVTASIAGCIAQEVEAPSPPTTPEDVIASAERFSGHVLISEGDTVVFNEAFGEAESGRAMTTEEHWRWASLTKQIVAVAIMDAVEEGSFGLDTTVGELLPEITGTGADAIQMRHLLQHTSGLRNPADLTQRELSAQMSSGLSPAALCLEAPERAPGAAFSYNNCDFIVLGAILERIDNSTWFESLNKRVFQPASMDEVYFRDPEQEETVSPPRGKSATTPIADFGAAGALYGKPTDVLAFDRALLDGRLLSDEARSALWEGNPELGFVALGQWSFSGQLNGCETVTPIIERRGDIGGIQARNILLPELDTSIIVFTNAPEFDFGEIWMGRGFSYDLLSAVACAS